ncbi:Auxin-responsive protein [Nymphaea thermarum]|nr:Auxin-responsive protein [Nymphaea thermarum]
MSTPSGKKGDKILQIVHLKRVLKKWRSFSSSSSTAVSGSSSPSTPTCSMSPKKFRRRSFSSRDGDEEDDIYPDAHRHQREGKIPAGCLPVYVGSEHRRFVIPTRYLNLPVFAALLKQAEEEFGYQRSGALALPCDVGFFAALLRALQKKEKAFVSLPLEDALRFVADAEAGGCSKQAGAVSSYPSPNDKGFLTPNYL